VTGAITYRVGKDLYQFVLDKQFHLLQIKFVFSAVVIGDYKITQLHIWS